MTDPRHAQQIPGKGRWYIHPTTGERWPSITNVLDVAVAKPALVPWSAKVTAEHAMNILPALVKAARKADTREQALKELKAQVRIVKDTAADLGTRIHDHAEAHVLGKPTADDPEVEPFAVQLVRFFTDFGVDITTDVEAAEATVINRTHGYAGTGDLWVWLHLDPTTGKWTPGKRHLWYIDYKSSATRPAVSLYPEHGMQCAAVAMGEVLLLDDGTEISPPGPIAGTAILNLRTDAYALIPTPADRDAAFNAFRHAVVQAGYLHDQYGVKPSPIAAPVREKASA